MLNIILMFVKACVLFGYAWHKFGTHNGFDISSGLWFDFKYLVFWFEKFNMFDIIKLFAAWDIYSLSIFILIFFCFINFSDSRAP